MLTSVLLRARSLARASVRFSLPVTVLASLAAAQSFDLLSVDVTPNQPRELNRPIVFTFSGGVDFASVNANTLRIVRASDGAPAIGDFTLGAPNVVSFQPRCPTRADLTDAGLTPGNWRIVVPDVASGSPTVTSTSGTANTTAADLAFSVPLPGGPVPTFLDTLPTPPAPVIRSSPSVRRASRLELADDASARVYFEPRVPADAQLGADVPAGFVAPLNLYSAQRTHVALVVVVDQMVALEPANLDRVRLEYESAPNTWVALARDVSLTANCTPTGASLRIAPAGVLPQNRRVRVVLGAGFADVGGQTLASDVVVGAFPVTTATDPGTTTPGDAADEIFEGFSSVTLEDPSGTFEPTLGIHVPRALWGEDGQLRAASFEGTGGVNGDFDWVVGNADGSPAVVILDTTFSVITNAQQTSTQNVIGGVVDVRSFWVRPGATLVIQGPNPCRILCSGTVPTTLAGYPAGTPSSGVLIQGVVKVNGRNNIGVVSFNTATIPEIGASGECGGGRGGTGNPLTTTSSPKGGDGFGPFDAPARGGVGGESGFTSLTDPTARRPAGGGGGRFGPDQRELTRPNCADQRLVGLDAESGVNGATTANGALHGVGFTPPLGGSAGPGPFVDGNATNDFWGTLVTSTGQSIRGELATPIGGSGGGGGGSCTRTATFPSVPFTNASDQKGAGGGGGGGALHIQALGDIRLGSIGVGARGRIEALGGTGGGGENTNGINRIGGGSGGGSGGHIVLESASTIDLSRITSVSTSQTTGLPPINWGGLFAKGGQGGEGENGTGGARAGGVETLPQTDSILWPGTYGSGAPCAVNTTGDYSSGSVGGVTNPPQFAFTNVTGLKICAGGDGGPGLVQLHAPTLSDIAPPNAPGAALRNCVFPLPVGATPAIAQTPASWNQLLPTFGRFSAARSKWIAIGQPQVAPGSATPDAVTLRFDGTDPATGFVRTTGAAPRQVLELAPLFTGTLASSPLLPALAADGRSVLLDGSLVDDLYRRNPNLMKQFVLRLSSGTPQDFTIGAASYSPASGVLRVTVVESGTPLAGYGPGASVALVPRFFAAGENDVEDELEGNVRIRFQAAPATVDGRPDEAAASPFVTDIAQLNVAGSPWRFVRFQVTFDLVSGGGVLTPSTPRPYLDFLRLQMRF